MSSNYFRFGQNDPLNPGVLTCCPCVKEPEQGDPCTESTYHLTAAGFDNGDVGNCCDQPGDSPFCEFANGLFVLDDQGPIFPADCLYSINQGYDTTCGGLNFSPGVGIVHSVAWRNFDLGGGDDWELKAKIVIDPTVSGCGFEPYDYLLYPADPSAASWVVPLVGIPNPIFPCSANAPNSVLVERP